MKYFCLSVIVTLLAFSFCCTNNTENTKHTIKLSDDVEVFQLAEGIWLHTTYMHVTGYGKVGANGLIVINGQIATIIDLPWTNKQAEILFDWIEKKHKATVKAVVPTHSHTDCAGGLGEAHKRGADSWAFIETIERLEKGERTVPRNGFAKTKTLTCGNTIVELAYLGGGHTADNIVAWIPSQKLLFGGCLVKAIDAKNLGNTKEADLDRYPETLRRVLQKYTDAKTVVPGHGEPGNLQLVEHTLKLCNNKN